MVEKTAPRIDKYLWSVRLFKTRSLASEACRNGRVQINGLAVKPSRTAEIGDRFTIRRPPAILSYMITGIPPSRVSAKLVSLYLEDLTPESERSKLEIRLTTTQGRRPRGTGRPTKKERRDLDRLHD
ncbi:MAG: RNA-binding S4 domain-containing protein [Bacteroidales bacterium]